MRAQSSCAWVGRGLDARRGARAAQASPGFRASTVEPECRYSCDWGTVHNTVLRTETVSEVRRPPGWSQRRVYRYELARWRRRVGRQGRAQPRRSAFRNARSDQVTGRSDDLPPTDHWTVIRALLMTRASRATSVSMIALNSSGVLHAASMPETTSRALISSIWTIFRSSSQSSLTMAAGVAAGARTP